MKAVSPQFKLDVDAYQRDFNARALIYFDGDANPPIEFGPDEIAQIKWLDEARATGSNPLGVVSSNEVYIVFDNTNKDFTATNINSPYYGKLKPNVKIELYLAITLSTEGIEELLMGTYWSGEWNAPSSTSEATVTAYDRLYQLGDLDTPQIAVLKDTNLKVLFETLFNKLGLLPAEYIIDASIANNTLSVGWLPSGKVRQCLQQFAIAGNCSVFVDHSNIIRVNDNSVIGASVCTLDDDSQIISADAPNKYSSIYSKVKVKYYIPSFRSGIKVLDFDYDVPSGGGTKTFNFPNDLVVNEVCLVRSDADLNSASLDDYSYDVNGITLIFTNYWGEAIKMKIVIIVNAAQMVPSSVIISDATALAEYGDKTLDIDSLFIQNEDIAQAYATAILTSVKQLDPDIQINYKGNPALEINDVITIDDATDKIQNFIAKIYRMELDYDGALSGALCARNKKGG